MKRGHDTRARAADGIATASPAAVRAAGAGLLLATLDLAAGAGPRAPAPISHRSPIPARAPVAVVPPAGQAPVAGEPVAPGQADPQAPVVEAEPVMAGLIEARPLGGAGGLAPHPTPPEARPGPRRPKTPSPAQTLPRPPARPAPGQRA